MVILLVGGSGRLIDDIINKLKKEGNRVYILTGNRFKHNTYEKVFEKYEFPYDSDCITEIFESVRPDLIIFMGAFDSNFEWRVQKEKEAVRYFSGLTNILIAFSALQNGRFIYLSSHEVFQGEYEEDIDENEKTKSVTTRAMALAQGEQMVLSYRNNLNMDAIVLRLDHLCKVPYNRKEVEDICSSMCLEAMEKRKIVVEQNEEFSLLFQSDAVQFIYQIVHAKQHKSAIYNLSSSEAISRDELAELVASKFSEDISIEKTYKEKKVRRVLSNRVFDGEFGLRIFNKTEDVVEKIAAKMQKKPGDYAPEESKKKGFFSRFMEKSMEIIRALIPFLENIIAFIPFFMLNNRAVGSDYFKNLDFYLLYVLLFAIVHGQHQAVFSAVLAVAGYCFRQMYDRSGFDVMLDYNTYIWIAQLFILGLVVGYMRDQIKIIKGEDEQEMGYLSGLLDDIEDINNSNVRMKNVLETQIVNQNDSVGKLYEITSSLEQYSPEEVLFYAAEVLSKIIDTEDVAIYTVANASYARLFSATSHKARELGNSVNYTNLGNLYESLKSRKVYVNREMDSRYPLMANAIYSDEEMQLIVMVWGIPWERMTLSQANMLTVISYLVQNAVVRANRYLEALEYKRYVGGTNILEPEAFASLVRAYMGAKSKGLTECTFLHIELGSSGLEEVGAILSKKLRQSDFLGELGQGDLYALLANTNEKDAHWVMDRFAELGYKSQIKEGLEV